MKENEEKQEDEGKEEEEEEQEEEEELGEVGRSWDKQYCLVDASHGGAHSQPTREITDGGRRQS